MADAQRIVSADWDGGWRAVVTAGEFELRVDEPPTVDGGTGTGPQPTELLLGAVASCFTLAVAHSARKRRVPLRALHVDAIGTYDGPRFSAIRVVVTAAEPTGPELARLVAVAERVCYVTRTLAGSPELTFEIG